MSPRFERFLVSALFGAFVGFATLADWGPPDSLAFAKFAAWVLASTAGVYALELAVGNGLLDHVERREREARIRAAAARRPRG